MFWHTAFRSLLAQFFHGQKTNVDAWGDRDLRMDGMMPIWFFWWTIFLWKFHLEINQLNAWPHWQFFFEFKSSTSGLLAELLLKLLLHPSETEFNLHLLLGRHGGTRPSYQHTRFCDLSFWWDSHMGELNFQGAPLHLVSCFRRYRKFGVLKHETCNPEVRILQHSWSISWTQEGFNISARILAEDGTMDAAVEIAAPRVCAPQLCLRPFYVPLVLASRAGASWNNFMAFRLTIPATAPWGALNPLQRMFLLKE